MICFVLLPITEDVNTPVFVLEVDWCLIYIGIYSSINACTAVTYFAID